MSWQKGKALTIACVGLSILTSCTSTNSPPPLETASPEATSLDIGDTESKTSLPVDSAEARGKTAKLSSEQTKELLNAELETPKFKRKLQAVVVPSYIPPGFEVEYFKTSSFLEGTDYFYEYYYIVYKSSSTDACFFVSASALDTEGAGAGPTEVEEIEKVKVEKLGIEIDMGLIGFDQSGDQGFSITTLGGQGEFESSDYAFGSPDRELCSQIISAGEMVKILESLQYLDPAETSKLQYDNGVVS